MHFRRCLQTPKIDNFGENSQKVSSQVPQYSRFWETFPGDLFRSELRGRGGSCRRRLCNGREKPLDLFPQVRNRLAIAREMPQQASLEETVKQRVQRAGGDDWLSATK